MTNDNLNEPYQIEEETTLQRISTPVGYIIPLAFIPAAARICYNGLSHLLQAQQTTDLIAANSYFSMGAGEFLLAGLIAGGIVVSGKLKSTSDRLEIERKILDLEGKMLDLRECIESISENDQVEKEEKK